MMIMMMTVMMMMMMMKRVIKLMIIPAITTLCHVEFANTIIRIGEEQSKKQNLASGSLLLATLRLG